MELIIKLCSRWWCNGLWCWLEVISMKRHHYYNWRHTVLLQFVYHMYISLLDRVGIPLKLASHCDLVCKVRLRSVNFVRYIHHLENRILLNQPWSTQWYNKLNPLDNYPLTFRHTHMESLLQWLIWYNHISSYNNKSSRLCFKVCLMGLLKQPLLCS